MKNRFFTLPLILLGIIIAVFFLYFNNTSFVSPKTQQFYTDLKVLLKLNDLSPNLLVVSTKRVKWHNEIQVKFSGATKDSRHLVGDAIDFIVFDINKDGISNYMDVDKVYEILDKKIMINHGGIGTYKNEKGFINRQMIHIDCRGYKARWHN